MSLFVQDFSTHDQRSQLIQTIVRQCCGFTTADKTVMTGQISECAVPQTQSQNENGRKAAGESQGNVGAEEYVCFNLFHCRTSLFDSNFMIADDLAIVHILTRQTAGSSSEIL